MPLSEEELRLLEQMERALAAEDPKFVSTLRGRTFERSARLRTGLAGLVFLVGIGALFGGAATRIVWFGVLGFVIMVASATVGLSAWRGRHAPAEPARRARAEHPAGGHRFGVIDGGRRDRGPRRSRSSFMERVEERWQRRRGQGF